MASLPPDRGAAWSAALIETAFRLIWSQRDQLLRIGLVPTVLSFLLQLVVRLQPSDAAILVSTLLEVVPASMFAVAGYRLLLLGPESLPPGLQPSLGRREARYILLTLGVALLGMLLVGIPLVALMSQVPADSFGMLLVLLLMALAALYGFGRLVLIFPACALDAPMSIVESVRRTTGVGGRLWLALMAILAVSLVTTMLADLLLRAVGLTQAAPLASSFALTALGYAGNALMLVPPALAFRELSGWRGPPQPPGLSVVR